MSIQEAWAELQTDYPQRGWWRRKGTRAAIVWEHTVKNAIDALADDAVVVPHNDTVSLIFDDRVLVRVKKADLELKSRNYPTRLAQLFHVPEADLFGYEALQRVEIVYVLNRFETEIDWIGIVARDGHSVIWQFELEDVPANVEILPLDASTQEAGEKTAESVAKLKKGVSEEREKNNKDT